jgi:hypothetical protein
MSGIQTYVQGERESDLLGALRNGHCCLDKLPDRAPVHTARRRRRDSISVQQKSSHHWRDHIHQAWPSRRRRHGFRLDGYDRRRAETRHTVGLVCRHRQRDFIRGACGLTFTHRGLPPESRSSPVHHRSIAGDAAVLFGNCRLLHHSIRIPVDAGCLCLPATQRHSVAAEFARPVPLPTGWRCICNTDDGCGGSRYIPDACADSLSTCCISYSPE